MRSSGSDYRIREATSGDIGEVMSIWRSSVDATHGFLAPDDRQSIEDQLEQSLPAMKTTLAVSSSDVPLAFMIIHGVHLEALFVHAAYRGKGLGSRLLKHAIEELHVRTVDVNEQNRRALGFYAAFGFAMSGRSAADSDGRPYPLIHLKLP